MSSPASCVETATVPRRTTADEPFVSIIMRSYNEGWALRETLPALHAQAYKNWELIVIDSGSTDGSTDLIRQVKPAHFIQIRHEDYNPSRVMNRGMELARAEFGIFLNADATPQGSDWLRPLVMALQDPDVAAVFGRQIPRPDCQAVYAHDYERCFGPHRESTRWDHFFSMVSSGLRKDIWSQRGFLEKMQYSEDDEYTRWCREQGYRIEYVPESVVMHSHNYTPQQAYKRSFGEAKALAAVWNDAPTDINFPKTVLLGWTNDARRDLVFCSRQRRLREWPHAARIRWHQRRAKLAGFREGWKFYRNGSDSRSSRREEAETISIIEDGASARIVPPKQSAPAISPPSPPRSGGEVVLRAHGQTETISPQQPRFTLDGSEALENNLSQLCEKVLAGIQVAVPSDKLEALVLGGGYGRGQGGVLKTKSGDAPYNDLEFYVFLRGNRLLNERRYQSALQELGERLSPEAGLHVEFKIDSLARLRRSPVTMFSYDLISGHRTLFAAAISLSPPANVVDERRWSTFPLSRRTGEGRGEGSARAEIYVEAPLRAQGKTSFDVQRSMFDVRCSDIFRGCEHHLAANKIPLAEATRLLLNRCTGLLLAKELLNQPELSPDDADFVGRNLAKAQLALGDAILVAAGKYYWNSLQRQTALTELAAKDGPSCLPEIRRHHVAGVDFKLHPHRVSKSAAEFRAEHEIISRLAQQVWLWLESRRLNQTLSSIRDYAFSPMEKCAGLPVWRNVLLNVKTFGPGALLSASAVRYPRERLFNALPLLLWDEPLQDLRIKYFLQKELQTGASDWQGFVAAYKAVWPKFS